MTRTGLIAWAVGGPLIIVLVFLEARRRQRANLPPMSSGYGFFWFGGLALMLAGFGDYCAGRESAVAYTVKAAFWWLCLPALASVVRKEALNRVEEEETTPPPCPACNGTGTASKAPTNG